MALGISRKEGEIIYIKEKSTGKVLKMKVTKILASKVNLAFVDEKEEFRILREEIYKSESPAKKDEDDNFGNC